MVSVWIVKESKLAAVLSSVWGSCCLDWAILLQYCVNLARVRTGTPADAVRPINIYDYMRLVLQACCGQAESVREGKGRASEDHPQVVERRKAYGTGDGCKN